MTNPQGTHGMACFLGVQDSEDEDRPMGAPTLRVDLDPETGAGAVRWLPDDLVNRAAGVDPDLARTCVLRDRVRRGRTIHHHRRAPRQRDLGRRRALTGAPQMINRAAPLRFRSAAGPPLIGGMIYGAPGRRTNRARPTSWRRGCSAGEARRSGRKFHFQDRRHLRFQRHSSALVNASTAAAGAQTRLVDFSQCRIASMRSSGSGTCFRSKGPDVIAGLSAIPAPRLGSRVVGEMETAHPARSLG